MDLMKDALSMRRAFQAIVFLAFAAFVSDPASACSNSASAPTGGGSTGAQIRASATIVCSKTAAGGSYFEVTIEKDGVLLSGTSIRVSISGTKSRQLTTTLPCSAGTYRTLSNGVVPSQGVNPVFSWSSPVQIVCSAHFTVPGTSTGLEAPGNVAYVGVTKNGTTTQELRVDYSTGGGNATAGVDYTPVSGTLIFPAGPTAQQLIVIPILDDPTIESVETFNLTLSNPTNGALLGLNGVGATTVISITDTDGPQTETISLADITLEGNNGGYTNQAVYQLTGNGDIYGYAVSCSPSCVGAWISPRTGMAKYQARAINNNCVNTGYVSLAFNTWYNLTTHPQWGLSLSSEAPNTASEMCSMTVQISAVSNPSVILSSAGVYFNLWTGP
jgi:hypothetical protein